MLLVDMHVFLCVFICIYICVSGCACVCVCASYVYTCMSTESIDSVCDLIIIVSKQKMPDKLHIPLIHLSQCLFT